MKIRNTIIVAAALALCCAAIVPAAAQDGAQSTETERVRQEEKARQAERARQEAHARQAEHERQAEQARHTLVAQHEQQERESQHARQAEQAALEEMERARAALNRDELSRAATEFAKAYEVLKHRTEAGDALYWEAFARYRMERVQEMKRAVELLHLQQQEYASAETAAEGRALMARLQAELARRGDPHALRDVEERADAENDADEARIYALHALMEMNPERALPLLRDIVTGAKPASPEFRRNAVFILCRVDDPQAEDALIELLHQTQDDPGMLSEVVMCLSMKESDRAMDALVEVFRKTEDPEVSEAALFAIGRHGGDRAFGLLTEIVRDPQAPSEQRQHALLGLSHVGRDREVAQLAAEIVRSDADHELQQMALMTLSRVDDDLATDVLMDLVNNPNADDEMRAQALFFAARQDKVSVGFLRDLYERAEGEDLKLQICHVLTQVDDEDAALDLLIEIARKEKSPELRQQAVFWVGRFDDERAAEFLMEVIEGR